MPAKGRKQAKPAQPKQTTQPSQPPRTTGMRTRGMGASPSGFKSLETAAARPAPVPKKKTKRTAEVLDKEMAEYWTSEKVNKKTKRKAAELESSQDEEAETIEPAAKRAKPLALTRNLSGHPKYGRASYGEENSDEEEIDMDAVAKQMAGRTPRDITISNRNILLQEKLRKEKVALEKERAELEKARKKNSSASASSSSPSEAQCFTYNNIGVTLALSRGPVLTARGIIGPLRTFCHWADLNPDRRLPTDSQMAQFLRDVETHEDAQSAAVSKSSRSSNDTTITSPEAASSQHQQHQRVGSQPPLHLESEAQTERSVGGQQPLHLEPEVQNVAMLNVQVAEEAATQDRASKVLTEVEEPQTPTSQQPNAQQSRGWFSTVSSFLTTPVKYFGRRRQSAEAAPTNSEAVVSGSSNEHLIPQTSDFAVQPVTPTNRLGGRKLISQSERRPSNQTFATAPITPTNPRNGRNIFPQTERRPGILSQGPKARPKTERHVRFQSPEERVPLHMRNVLSEEQKQEIWRKQDEDIHLKQRQDRRGKRHARAEDEDERDATPHIESARTGEKRKHYHPDVPPGAWNWEGTFSVPDSPPSSEDGEDISEHDDLESRGGGSSVRKDRYDGTLFAQPPDVQANIDEGLYPVAPRRGMTAKEWKVVDNIFGRALNKSFDDDALLEQQPAGSSDGGSGTTFKAPSYENESGNEESGIETEAVVENASEDGSVLQPKTWTQTPPPKPKPSNAQLPSNPQEIAKARHEKYKPARPSGLRNVSVMSPLAQPEATTEAAIETRLPWDIPLKELGIFSPEVLAAYEALPYEAIPRTQLPARFYEQQLEVPPEVKKAVLGLLG